MSTFKQIRNKGVHQEDVVELLDALSQQRVSILNYLSTLGNMCSRVFGEMSDMTTPLSLSMSGTYGNGADAQSFGISTRTGGFITSMTTLTAVTVTTV